MDLLLRNNQIYYTEKDLQLLVFKLKNNLINVVINEFNWARENLAETREDFKKEFIFPFSFSIQEKITKIYPDGQIIEGEFVQIRIERVQFGDLIDSLRELKNYMNHYHVDINRQQLYTIYNWLRSFFH